MIYGTFTQRVFLVGLLSALMVGSSALAQRGDRGRGGGDRGGGRSSSRGDSGSRSFSRGDSGGRSFSRGDSGRSSRSMSSRSFSGDTSRYSRGSSDNSSRSFSRGPSRSFSEGSRSSSPSMRSFEGSRSYSRPSQGDSSSSRTFRVEPRQSGDSRQTFRPSQPGSSDRSSESGVQRNFNRGSSESSQFSRRFNSDSNRSAGEFNRSRDEGGKAQSSNRREYMAGRPTNDQVRDFLRRGDSERGATQGSTDSGRQQSFRNRVAESQKDGDRAWSRRFGGDRGDDRTSRNENERARVGDVTRRPDSDRSFNGRRDFGDRNFVDNKYQTWKKGAWRGDGDKRGDNRDWSGRWKDGDRFVAADRIRKNWDRDHDHDDFPFHSGWKNRHWHGGHNHWNDWGYWGHRAHFHNRPWYWWSWTTAPLLTSWVNFGWNTPYYWDYGPGEYIYCYDDVIYVNGRWFQPAPVYYDNAVVLAQSAPDWTPEQAQQVEWLPLGVFAIARDGVPDQNLLVQLAVTKDGVIGGTASNKLTGVSFPIEGKVDNETQRAVWTYTDDKDARIVMETSVYNLTQPEATGLVHYGPDDIQVVELVRLDKPVDGTSPATAAPSTPPAELPAP